MADKEWVITKVSITALALVTIISICIGGANVLFEVKRDVVRVDKNLTDHSVRDEKSWDKVWKAVDNNQADIHSLELQSARQETNQKEILRRLDNLQLTLNNFEVK